ncbi:MAG: hypothetical protein ACRDVW_07345 [Acidimicrobiales bacterium]
MLTWRLQRLADRRTAVVSVNSDPALGYETVDFVDGTRLELEIPDQTVKFERLGHRFVLEYCGRCNRHCWCRLRFRSSGGLQLDFFARVRLVTRTEV